VFLSVQILTPLFFLTVSNFVVFFKSLDRKYNEDYKNVFKSVIVLLQEGFTGDFDLTVLSNCVSGSSNFDTTFLPDNTKFCSVCSGYWIGNLMRIPKMCLKVSFPHSQ